MRLVFFISICLLAAGGLKAQSSSQRQWLSDPLLTVAVQPASLADTAMPGISFQANGSLVLAGSAGILDLYFQNDGFIDSEEKQVILDRLGKDNQFQYFNEIGPMLIAGRIGKIPFSLSYQQNRSNAIGFNSPESMELLLRGNAVFAGETVRDSINYHQLRTDRLSLGTAARLGKVSVGIRAHYLVGTSMAALDRFNYGLYTADDGTNLNLGADYSLFESTDKGWGLGMDLGITTPLNDKISLQLAVFDIGFMQWDGRKMENNVSVDFSGINLNDLVDGKLTDIQLEDTLRKSLFPDTLQVSMNHALPARVNIGLSYRLNEKSLVFAQASGAMGPFAPGGGNPMFILGYQRTLKSLTLGGQAFIGGTEGWGIGAIVAYQIHTKKGFHLDLVGEIQNGMGIITQSNGGLRGQAGIALGF